MDSLTVEELIEQLSKFDKTKKVVVSHVGISKFDSWDANLELEEDTVDEHENIVRINFTTI